MRASKLPPENRASIQTEAENGLLRVISGLGAIA